MTPLECGGSGGARVRAQGRMESVFICSGDCEYRDEDRCGDTVGGFVAVR